MTQFEFITQDVETLAAFIYGILEETESRVIDRIYCSTGIEITSVSLSPELRIASIMSDLLKEREVDNDRTSH